MKKTDRIPTSAIPPVTYVLDYGPHLGNEVAMRDVERWPPDHLHLGKEVAFTHNWGPIAGHYGENQFSGRTDEEREAFLKRLTPAGVRERIAALREMNRRFHEAGVKVVTVYISANTIGGHHERRTGLWDFYDHWDEYSEFDLGSRPEVDPATWMQMGLDGKIFRHYTYEGDYYPSYKPHHRYAACHSNPHWNAWLGKVTAWCIKCGYDGVFVDNAGSQRCYCDYCQTGFREWVGSRYTPEEVRELFGVASVDDVRLAVGKDEIDLPWVETKRFWVEVIRRQQALIRAAGEAVIGKGKFYLFPNGGCVQSNKVRLGYADCDWIMYENSWSYIGAYGTHAGTVVPPPDVELKRKTLQHNIFDYKYTQCLGRRVRPIVLTRTGEPNGATWLEQNPTSAYLALAEGSAFGPGGGCTVADSYTEPVGKVRQQFRRFFEERADLFLGARSCAEIGLVVSSDHIFYEAQGYYAFETPHLRDGVTPLVAEFAQRSVLFDFLLEDDLATRDLSGYRVVVAPLLTYLDPDQAGGLRRYVEGGGYLALIGPPPSRTMKLRPLDLSLSGGSGKVIRFPAVPDAGLLAGDSLDSKAIAERVHPVMLDQSDDRCIAANSFVTEQEGVPKSLLLHLVNYRVPLGRGAPSPTRIDRVTARIPLPSGRGISGVTLFEPDQAPVDATWEIADGFLTIRVSDFWIYKVCRVSLIDE